MHHRTLALVLLAAVAVPARASSIPDYVQKSAYGVRVDAYAKENSFYGSSWGNVDIDTKGGIGSKSASTYTSVGNGHSTAYGSLDTGAMHLGAFSSGPSGYDDLGSPLHSVEAVATVDVWDTVTVYWGKEDVRRLPLTVQFEGSRSGPRAYVGFEYHGAQSSMDYTVNQDFFRVDDFILAPLVDTPVRTTTFKVYAHAYVRADAINSPFQTGYGFEGESSVSDFTHTLKFMWDLPEGVTFTSASGAFRPQPTQPVPEPAAFAPLGLGALALLKRRRKHG